MEAVADGGVYRVNANQAAAVDASIERPDFIGEIQSDFGYSEAGRRRESRFFLWWDSENRMFLHPISWDNTFTLTQKFEQAH